MLDDLTQLDDETLIDLKARISLELDARRSEQADNRERAHHHALATVLKQAGYPLMPWGAFTKTTAYPTFKKASAAVSQFTETHLCPEAEVERIAVERFLVRMTLRYMTRCRIPLKAMPVIQQWGQPAKYIDVELPGYLSSGMLRAAILRKALS